MPIIYRNPDTRSRRRRAALEGLGAPVTESHPEILVAAQAIAGAAGMPVVCQQETVDNVGGRWFVRTCDPAGFPNANFDADMIAAGNVGPALEMWRAMTAQSQPAASSPPITSFTDYVPPASNTGTSTGTQTPAATCDAEAGSARAYWLGLLAKYGVSNDPRYTSKLNSAFAEGLTWWRASHPNYCGLYAYVMANADATVRAWIAELGIVPPTTSTGTQTPGTQTPGTQTPAAPADESLIDKFWKTISIGSPATGSTGSTAASTAASITDRLSNLPTWAYAAAAAALYLMTRKQGRR